MTDLARISSSSVASSSSLSRSAAWISIEEILSGQLWLLLTTLIFALQSVLILTHSAWLDEWQALLIAGQSPTIRNLLENLRYEGHPPLWYFLLRAAHSVLPTRWTLAGVQLPIALITQSLILFRSPFPRLDRLLLATSAFVLFEWCTIARDLSLGVLFTFSAIAVRNRQFHWLFIALLPMVGVQFGLLSIALMTLDAADGRWRWWGAGLWLLSAILAALSVIPAPDMYPAQTLLAFPNNFLQTIIRLSVSAVPIQIYKGHISWNSLPPIYVALPASLFFLIFSIKETSNTPLNLFTYAFFLIATLTFASLVYPLFPRHLTLLVLFLIVLKWRDAEEGLVLRPGIRLWLALSSACGLLVATLNLITPFDTAPVAARMIQNLGLEKARWAAWPASHGEDISGMLGIEFLSLGKNCTNSFIRWNDKNYVRFPKLRSTLLKNADYYGEYYLITDRKLPFQTNLIKNITEIQPGFDQLSYYFYKISPGRAQKTIPMAPCAPERRRL